MRIQASLIAAAAVAMLGGCGTIAQQQRSTVSAPATTPLPAANVNAPMPHRAAITNKGAASDAATATLSPVSQVGFFHGNAPQHQYQVSDLGCQACGPQPCGTGNCGTGNCGIQACTPEPCQVTPHGYAMPYLPCPPGFDPQEYLCDGGDADPRAIVRRDDSIGGLQPEDTVVAYTTERGDIEVNASNKVCFYAPRFASVRKITGAVAGGRAIGLQGFDLPVGANNLELNEGGVVIGESLELGHAEVARRIDAMRDRNRGVPVENVQQIVQSVDVLAVLAGLRFDQLAEMRDEDLAVVEKLALAAVAWTIDESVQVAIEDMKPPTLTRDQSVDGLTLYEFPDAGRLQICKLADRADARPGEIVTFALRVENVGDSAVNNITITDNLTTRLEYVPESQTCSGGAIFDTVANEGQSLQLIWKLTDKLRVGESVTIRFQCKVR